LGIGLFCDRREERVEVALEEFALVRVGDLRGYPPRPADIRGRYLPLSTSELEVATTASRALG
jgi:hypothetical protein